MEDGNGNEFGSDAKDDFAAAGILHDALVGQCSILEIEYVSDDGSK